MNSYLMKKDLKFLNTNSSVIKECAAQSMDSTVVNLQFITLLNFYEFVFGKGHMVNRNFKI